MYLSGHAIETVYWIPELAAISPVADANGPLTPAVAVSVANVTRSTIETAGPAFPPIYHPYVVASVDAAKNILPELNVPRTLAAIVSLE
jgi:hypothetical protein